MAVRASITISEESKKKPLKPKLTVEAFLSNKVAVATLRVLIQRDMPQPLSRIARDVGSNFVTVRKHMKLLKEANFITTLEYGTRTLYKANMNSERVLVFKSFIEGWERKEAESGES